MTGTPHVAAVVLAAGQGRRFDVGPRESKLLAVLDGEPLVRRVAAAALTSRASPVVVVTGHAAPAVEAALAELAVQIVRNPTHTAGLAGSLKAGLAGLGPTAAGAIILLADMPRVTAATLDRLVAAFEAAPSDTEVVIPVHDGKRGNPVLIAATLFEHVASLKGDAGARVLIDAPGRRLILCPVDDPGILVDIDTRDALRALAHGNYNRSL